MALLGSLLPGILGAINPANLIKGVLNSGVGVLENIAKGKLDEIPSTLARGLKTAIGAEQSALGSIGGMNSLEPTDQEKILGARNAANLTAGERMDRISHDLHPSAARNAANLRGVYSEDRTRDSGLGGSPVNEMVSIGESVESAPAGMPDRRIAIVHGDHRRAPAMDLLNSRDQFGYKSIPVVMSGVRPSNHVVHGKNTHERAALSDHKPRSIIKEDKMEIDDDIIIPKFKIKNGHK